jgi:AcrR family transcriptional regulator
MKDPPLVLPTRERILDTSKELFARRGYHGSSIRDIAGALNVSVSAVYNHFRSKDAILLEVLRRPIVDQTIAIEGVLASSPGGDALDRLALCLRVHYAYLLGHKLDAELINSEYLRLTDEARASIVKLRNAYEAIFRRLVVGCLPAGQREPEPPAVTVAVNILLGLAGNNHRWFREDGPMSSNQVLDFYVRFAIGGLRAALNEGRQHTG